MDGQHQAAGTLLAFLMKGGIATAAVQHYCKRWLLSRNFLLFRFFSSKNRLCDLLCINKGRTVPLKTSVTKT